jgi:predicted alternative tryptophan synthase beta-subunit
MGAGVKSSAVAASYYNVVVVLEDLMTCTIAGDTESAVQLATQEMLQHSCNCSLSKFCSVSPVASRTVSYISACDAMLFPSDIWIVPHSFPHSGRQ